MIRFIVFYFHSFSIENTGERIFSLNQTSAFRRLRIQNRSGWLNFYVVTVGKCLCIFGLSVNEMDYVGNI